MSEKHALEPLFNPRSVAIIGASERHGSVGKKVMQNLLHSQFAGDLYPVNPKHKHVLKKTCCASVLEISKKIDLAVITTPAQTVPDIMRECGKQGIRHVVIITAGFSEMGEQGKALEQSVLDIAQQYHIRFIGPNCLGIMRPKAKLNATFDNNFALPGKIALVSQSGALCAAILDWALEQAIGFSTIVSMGNSIDLDFGDVLEYLALDPATKSILLYIEGVHYSQRFISGLRVAARMKPVIAIKAGRHTSGGRAVHSHTGALIGDDLVFSTALARGGAVRVTSIEDLFTAAQVLSSDYRTQGKRLTIITNGGGAGAIAADRAADLNLELPNVDPKTLTTLNACLPPQWSHQNPIDIIGDAPPKRYRDALNACLQDNSSDGILTILVPISMTEPHAVAEEVCAIAKKMSKPLLACWMGEHQVKSSWKLFTKQKIPCFSTPEKAVEAFSYLADYHYNQQLLLQTPAPLTTITKNDAAAAKLIVKKALAEQRQILSTLESKAILAAFSIPVAKTIEVHSAQEAGAMAESLGFPVVMKISSPDITHKQDVEGVQLNITDVDKARTAYENMLAAVKKHKPDAKVTGVTVERMYKQPNSRELMLGVIKDKVFGPVIAFGMGGSLVEVIQDRAIALPPLNDLLARELIARSKASKLLGEFRGKPPVAMDLLVDILLRVSDLVCELPEIQEMDINPLLLNEKEALVVDARFVVAPYTTTGEEYGHMAIVTEAQPSLAF